MRVTLLAAFAACITAWPAALPPPTTTTCVPVNTRMSVIGTM
jgi:hypothetical protein